MKLKNILTYFISFMIQFSIVEAKEIYVGKSHLCKSISEAIKAAKPFDKIIIQEGIYKERIIINKPLEIVGIGLPILDGEKKGDIILIQSDCVIIEGLKVENTGTSSIKDFAGIKIEQSTNCHVKNNHLTNTFFGIYLSNSQDCEVRHNQLNGHALKESNSGNGIHLWKCRNIDIENNRTLSHRDGVYLEFSENCIIKDNQSEENLRYGLHFMFSHGNKYIHNVFKKNGAGVAVMYTENIEMTDNVFEENWGPSSYGLLLKDIKKSVIKRNKFVNNTIGVYMEGTSKIELIENEFKSNGWGIKLMGNSIENKISQNNFLSNTFDIATNSLETGKQNYTSQNYWDQYKGFDLNRDNIGDVPFRPVSLFSVYVEKIPFSIILLRSFMVDLLNTIEQAVPAVIPETFADEKPLMTKVSL